MSRTAVLQSTKSVPSKIFLIGEYAVLSGAPALVAAIPPRFELHPSEEVLRFHPDSPAAKILADTELRAAFHDPHRGSGGFGGSTAEFALVQNALQPGLHWRELLARYHEVCPQASGADLLAQWSGGVVSYDPHAGAVESIDTELKFIFVFSAAHQPARKVKTHAHLSELGNKNFGFLKERVVSATEAFRRENWAEFGASLNDYATRLGSMGLETSATHEDRTELSSLAGVLGVKGCGALQSDAIIVVFDSEKCDRTKVLEVAKSRDLKLICEGLKKERGLE